jgi:hypothetical protein
MQADKRGTLTITIMNTTITATEPPAGHYVFLL